MLRRGVYVNIDGLKGKHDTESTVSEVINLYDGTNDF
jgi:hypothetical protein